MIKPATLLFLLSGLLSGQTISGIAISDVDQHHCRIVANISADSYVHINYGIASGGPYPWNTYRYLTGQDANGYGDHNKIALNISALAPGTTYYGVILAGSGVTADSVTSSQFSCTTTTGSPYPASPTAYLPGYPATSGYTTVPLTVSSNLFVAASSVTHPAGTACPLDPGWSVTMGDSLSKIISEVNWGAVIEFPQGVTGQTPAHSPGYVMPAIAVDPCASGISDPNHRWVIFRTHQAGAADFPPYGFRTGPQWLSKMATLQAETPQIPYTNGQHFSLSLPSASATPIHHFWFSNIHLTVDTTQGSAWGTFFLLSNTEGNPPDAANPSSYIVIDRMFLDAPVPPTFAATGIDGGAGTDVLIRGNYVVGFQQSGGLGQALYIYDNSIGPLTVENNEFSAAGANIYIETNDNNTAPLQNVVIAHNALYESPNWLNPINAGYGTWDGVSRGPLRNPFEAKYCQVCLLRGNIIDGSFSGQNAGQAILWTGTINPNQTPGATGMRDLEVTGNLIRHAAVVMDAQGSETISNCCGYGPDVSLTERLFFHNNVALNLGRYLYTDRNSVGGLFSNYFLNFGVQGEIIQNNTLGFTDAECCLNGLYYTPQIQTVSDGGHSNGGFQFTGNLMYLSYGVTGVNGVYAYTQTCLGGCSAFPVVPLPTTTSSNTVLATNAVSLTSTLNPTAIWRTNTVVCGTYANGAWPWPDLTASECSSLIPTMPAADSYVPGNTRTARQVNAGLLKIANDDPTITPTAYNFGGATGATLPLVESELGVVSNISVVAGPSALLFTYTAPDSSACSIDTRSNGSSTWTRTTDAGGSLVRATTITGLPSSTTIQYRLMCYFAQANAGGPDEPWFSIPWDHTDLQTEGTVTTSPSASRTVLQTFTLPSGASQAVLSFTPVSGSPVSQTCASSPCWVTLNAGTYTRSLTFETSGSAVVGTQSTTIVTIN